MSPVATSAVALPARRRRRRAGGWLLALLMLVVAGVGVGLIIRGSSSTAPLPAPTPDHPFSVAAPPRALVPGDVIPPAGGPVGPSGHEVDPAADPNGPGPDHIEPGVSDGTPTEPPKHVGPWTFDGPNRIFIQSLGVEAPIDPVGSQDGAMIVPTDVRRVGRWDAGAELSGDEGTVLIVGHVNYASQGPGVLFDLYRTQPGAVIVTNDSNGVRSSWRVVSLESVDKQALPSDIFAGTGDRRLVLVTCGGELLHVDGPDGGYNTYENNVVVRAVPA